MRSLWIVAAAACGGGHAPDADAPGATGHVDIRGSCAFPLGSDGALEFPDTAVAVQTSYRPIDVVNTGVGFTGRELVHWEVEGADAANFAVTTGIQADADVESCSLHEMDTVQFPTGAFCRLDVTFQPQTLGPKQATLHVTYANIIDQTFTVRGNAIAAPNGLFASTPDLYVKPPTTQGGQGFRLVNAGATNIDLGNPVVTGPFSFAPPGPPWNCPSPLTAGGACTTG
jgi:hypothetical protein